MKTALLRHLTAMRENFRHIGAAVNASREFSRAGSARSTGDKTDPQTVGIPL